MSGAIYILGDNGSLTALVERKYDSEALLQTLLAKYPSILAGDQISPQTPRKWLLIRREVGVPDEDGGAERWSLDHLFLDQDAIPTLVEVKRSTDTRIRREVVGQMLDYAANAMAYWSVESIRASFEHTCGEAELSAGDALSDFLDDESDANEFWNRVKTNLQAGRLRLLFVADEIPDELRRVIEFLNAQMDPAEVLAIEIKQFAGESLKTLVPRLIGQTAEAERRKGSGKSTAVPWNESSFFEKLESNAGADQSGVARAILDWARSNASRIWWGRGTGTGSFVPILQRGREKHQLCSVHTGWKSTPPGIETQFQYLASKKPFEDPEKRRELLRKFNTIPGVNFSADAIDRRPSIPLAVFTSAAALRQLFDIFDWYQDQVNLTDSQPEA